MPVSLYPVLLMIGLLTGVFLMRVGFLFLDCVSPKRFASFGLTCFFTTMLSRCVTYFCRGQLFCRGQRTARRHTSPLTNAPQQLPSSALPYQLPTNSPATPCARCFFLFGSILIHVQAQHTTWFSWMLMATRHENRTVRIVMMPRLYG